MITLASEFREKIDYGSIKDWIIPGLISLGLHGFVGGLMYSSFQKDELEVKPRITLDEKVLELIEQPPCQVNPYRGIISEDEKEFVSGLVEDLKDQKLDSMSFGEWMVRAETFVHNREVYCEKEKWNADTEVDEFNQRRDFVLKEYEQDNELLFAADVFHYLHEGVEYERANELRGTINQHLLNPVLGNYREFQARALEALKSGGYNCESGTMWFTALTDILGDKVRVYVYDDHVLSNVKSDEIIIVENWLGRRVVNEGHFENTDVNGDFAELKIEGVLRPKEVFVVNYLVGHDKLQDLPEEFQEWYKTEAAVGLVNHRTNTFGNSAPAGMRISNPDEELDDFPGLYELRGVGISTVLFDDSRYNWEEIYTKTGNMIVENQNEYDVNALFRLLQQHCFALERIGKKFGSFADAKAQCKESYYYLAEEEFLALNDFLSGTSDLNEDEVFYTGINLGNFLRRQNGLVVRTIINDGDFRGLEEKLVQQNIELLNSVRDAVFQRTLFFNLGYDFIRVKKGWEVENIEDYRKALVDVAFKQLDLEFEENIWSMLDSGLIVDFLLDSSILVKDYGTINRILSKIAKEPKVPYMRSVMYISFEYPEMFNRSEVIEIFDRTFENRDSCKKGQECIDSSYMRSRLCLGYSREIPSSKICEWCEPFPEVYMNYCE